MDPVTAFGLAAGILQFLDCGSRYATTAWKIYRNGQEGLKDVAEIRVIVEDLQSALKSLQLSVPKASGEGETQPGIVTLAKECQKVAGDLVDSLSKIPTSERFGKREAFKAAIKVIRTKEEIHNLEGRITAFRQQLTFHLLVSLQSVAS
jgi:hypothetical protein